MPSEVEVDFSTESYRCKDISEFKIRVHIKTVKASSVPLSGLEEDVEDDKHEEQEFLWQQRVFSPREIKYYSEPNNCVSQLDQNYHEEVIKLANDSNSGKNILFSYTSPDVSEMKLERNILSYRSKIQTHLSEAMRNLESLDSSKLNTDIQKRKIINCNQGEDSKISNHLSSNRYESMFIMADVGYLTEGEANEQVLVMMNYDNLLKVLTVFPDFNCSISGSGYILEGLSDACNQYVFWLIHADAEDSRRIGTKDKKDRIVAEEHIISPMDVILPRHGQLSVHIFGEIKGARHFDFDSLFVCYYFELPNRWNCNTPNDLSGITQRSKSKDGFSFLNHLFELELILNLSLCDEQVSITESECLFPKLSVDVVVMDEWGRVRREGSCWTRVLPVPGRQEFQLQTWRLQERLSRSCTSMLQRYFIGATPHLADRSFNGIPENFQGSDLSKFGVRTVSSGEVELTLDVVLHSQSSASFSQVPSRFSILDRLSAVTLLQSVNIALKAFSWARQRMLTAVQSPS